MLITDMVKFWLLLECEVKFNITIQFMDELVELASEENKSRAMSSKIYDLDDLIDIKEYVRHIEEEQRKKAEQKRGNVR